MTNAQPAFPPLPEEPTFLTEVDFGVLQDAASQIAGERRVIVPLRNGYSLSIWVAPDEGHTIEDDGDWFGQVEWTRIGASGTRWAPRPEGFDGNAQKLIVDYPDVLWWQPPSDVARGTEDFEKLRTNLLDLLQYGWIVVFMELREHCEHCGTDKVIARDVLGGVAAFESAEFLTDMLREMAYNLNIGTKSHGVRA